jgi:uncharacterized protein YggE
MAETATLYFPALRERETRGIGSPHRTFHAMKITKIAAALTLAAGWAAMPVLAAAADAPSESTLTVTGQGVISRAPDQAILNVQIVTNDDNATRALSDNNTHYATLVTKVAAAGITPANIRSTTLNTYFNPRPEQVNLQYAARYGYVVTRSALITVNALDTTGAVIDATTAAGSTTIGGVSYGFRDSHAIEHAALTAAVNDAAEQARTIADAAHVRVVRILHITNNTTPIARPLLMASSIVRTLDAPARPVPTNLPPADLDVRASVAITYVIGP